jgi:hypothetical protein
LGHNGRSQLTRKPFFRINRFANVCDCMATRRVFRDVSDPTAELYTVLNPERGGVCREIVDIFLSNVS